VKAGVRDNNRCATSRENLCEVLEEPTLSAGPADDSLPVNFPVHQQGPAIARNRCCEGVKRAPERCPVDQEKRLWVSPISLLANRRENASTSMCRCGLPIKRSTRLMQCLAATFRRLPLRPSPATTEDHDPVNELVASQPFLGTSPTPNPPRRGPSLRRCTRNPPAPHPSRRRDSPH
jgi:hypothetical protein